MIVEQVRYAVAQGIAACGHAQQMA
jgi:hypothetical protein